GLSTASLVLLQCLMLRNCITSTQHPGSSSSACIRREQTTKRTFRSFARQSTSSGLPFPSSVDAKQKMFQDYLCDLWPSQFVIDRQGVVRYTHGGVERYDDMNEVCERLLSEK